MKPAIFCFALTVLVLTGCSRQRIPMTSISPDFRNYHIDWDTSEYIPSPAMLPQITYTPPVVHDSLWCYEQAFKELKAMLTGDTLLSFKRAVFITENAYLNNMIDYEKFNKAISYETALCSSIKSYSRLKNYHHWKDSANVVTNEAIFSLMDKPIVLSKEAPFTISSPFTYNFADCFGDSDWTNTFVLKTLITHKGNCRSLTFLYKILTDEFGTQSSLALAPNHIYVKQRSDKLVMYNTELTSGLNPIDGWIMAANYISLESVQKGVYMKALTDKQNLAVCLLDLAEGYKHKFKNDTARFILKCADLALEYNPKYIDALQLKGRTWKRIYNRTKSKTAYKKMDSAYVAIMSFGYQEMPEWEYQQWLAEMDKEKDKYVAKKQVQGTYPNRNMYFGYDDKAAAILHNPYKELHVKPPTMISLSGGKYEEFFDLKELVPIDDVIISRKKNKVVQFAFDKKLRPEGITRWMSPDPLAQNFASVSPYMALGDNPILYVDPDGRDIIPSPQLQSSKWGLVIKTMQAQMVSNSVVNKYFGQFTGANSNHDWRMSYEATPDPLAVGYTFSSTEPSASMFNPAWTVHLGDPVTQGQNAYAGFNASIYSDLGMASVVLHEAVHTFLTKQNPGMGNDEQHELMATKYRGDLVSGITQFAKDNKIDISSQDAQDLSWGGLTDTKAFTTQFGEEGKRTDAQQTEYNRWSSNFTKLSTSGGFVKTGADPSAPESSTNQDKGKYDLPQR